MRHAGVLKKLNWNASIVWANPTVADSREGYPQNAKWSMTTAAGPAHPAASVKTSWRHLRFARVRLLLSGNRSSGLQFFGNIRGMVHLQNFWELSSCQIRGFSTESRGRERIIYQSP